MPPSLLGLMSPGVQDPNMFSPVGFQPTGASPDGNPRPDYDKVLAAFKMPALLGTGDRKTSREETSLENGLRTSPQQEPSPKENAELFSSESVERIRQTQQQRQLQEQQTQLQLQLQQHLQHQNSLAALQGSASSRLGLQMPPSIVTSFAPLTGSTSSGTSPSLAMPMSISPVMSLPEAQAQAQAQVQAKAHQERTEHLGKGPYPAKKRLKKKKAELPEERPLHIEGLTSLPGVTMMSPASTPQNAMPYNTDPRQLRQAELLNLNLTQQDEGYRCSVCQKLFSYKQHLQTHIKTVHLKIREYSCDLCGKRFGEKSALRKHTKTVHERIRPYKCDKCGSTFGQKAHLSKHEQSKFGCSGKLKSLVPGASEGSEKKPPS